MVHLKSPLWRPGRNMKECRYNSTISLTSTLHGDTCSASCIGGLTAGGRGTNFTYSTWVWVAPEPVWGLCIRENCPCLESNYGSSTLQPAVQSLHRLQYLGSKISSKSYLNIKFSTVSIGSVKYLKDISVYLENQTQHLNIPCRQNADFLNVVQSRFSESRFLEVPFCPSQCFKDFFCGINEREGFGFCTP